jgi:outer membrane protein OmpA-like peptidoglycan-associated protein/opacity protein-like surface antigen
MGIFRIEIEASQKKAELENFTTTFNVPVFSGTDTGPSGNFRRFDNSVGRTKIQSLMLNGLLDFGNSEGTSGFIGGGVGFARVEVAVAPFSNLPGIINDRDNSTIAWQLIAGLRQALTPTIDAHLKYRYFNTRELDFENNVGGFVQPGGAVFSADTTTKIRTHSLLGGLTFNFGAPPAPVVVVPPVIVETPPPQVQMQTCPNGTVIPVTQVCPVVQAPVVGPFIVFFDWDRSDITPQAAAILDNAAAAYQQTGQAQVVLAGHADRSGSADYNVGLSQRRADAVRSYLAGRGVPSGAIATEAFGESRPLVETADGVREPQNRRVEITFGQGAGR